MKINNKGLTLIELIFSMVLLSVILLFLYSLINNIVLNEKEYVYDNIVDSSMIVETINNDLIKYGLSYTDTFNDAITGTGDENHYNVTINTRLRNGEKGILNINISKNDDNWKIQYIDIEGRKYIWNLSETLDVDLNTESIINKIETIMDPNVMYKLNIPIYSKTGTINVKDNNDFKDDIIIEYFGKIVKYAGTTKITQNFTNYLINSGELWQSGLDGDGYRFIGAGEYEHCIYDNSAYYPFIDGECPDLYDCIRTNVETGETNDNYHYVKSCPTNSTKYTFESIKTHKGHSGNVQPNNYICFGTSNLEECKSNEEKYMYRVIGVFPDNAGNQHVKLISLKQHGKYQWHNKNEDVEWKDSSLFKGLNGEYFLTNPNYDYLQNPIWINKIIDWNWISYNTNTNDDRFDSTKRISFWTQTATTIYNYEMQKRTDKGSWSNVTAKIGLIYLSDYALSSGTSAVSNFINQNILFSTHQLGWIHSSHNDTSKATTESTLTQYGKDGSYFYIWHIRSNGSIYYTDDGNSTQPVTYLTAVRPVFYLDSNVSVSGGSGTYDDPYILDE